MKEAGEILRFRQSYFLHAAVDPSCIPDAFFTLLGRGSYLFRDFVH
jgi:hypothetical protein